MERGQGSRMIKLTPKEREICDLIVMGLTNKQIAARLHCSHRTVEEHRRNVFEKYNVVNSVLLVRKIFNIQETA